MKAKPSISRAEMTSLDVLADKVDPLDLEPEYMPPRVKGDQSLPQQCHQSYFQQTCLITPMICHMI